MNPAGYSEIGCDCGSDQLLGFWRARQHTFWLRRVRDQMDRESMTRSQVNGPGPPCLLIIADEVPIKGGKEYQDQLSEDAII